MPTGENNTRLPVSDATFQSSVLGGCKHHNSAQKGKELIHRKVPQYPHLNENSPEEKCSQLSAQEGLHIFQQTEDSFVLPTLSKPQILFAFLTGGCFYYLLHAGLGMEEIVIIMAIQIKKSCLTRRLVRAPKTSIADIAGQASHSCLRDEHQRRATGRRCLWASSLSPTHLVSRTHATGLSRIAQRQVSFGQHDAIFKMSFLNNHSQYLEVTRYH